MRGTYGGRNPAADGGMASTIVPVCHRSVCQIRLSGFFGFTGGGDSLSAITSPQPQAASRSRVEMTGAQILWAALEREGVHTVFGYPGGAILPVYDALRDSSVRHILVRHE